MMMWLKLQSRSLQQIFLSSVSGLVLSLSFPGAGLDFLAWFAFVPFFFAIKDGNKKENLVSGLCFGLAHFLSLLYWVVYTLNIYGYIPLFLCIPIVLLLALYLSCYPMVFAWFVTRNARQPAFLIVILPSLWVCLEYVRAYALTGFPWELLGYSQHRIISLIQIADITGVYGISFLVVLANTAVFSVFLFFSKHTWQSEAVSGKTALTHGTAAILCLALILAYGNIRVRMTDNDMAQARSTRVSVIQGNIDQSLKWSPSYQARTVFKYNALSQLAAKDKPDLIVWPETAAPFYYGHDKALTALVQRSLETSGAELLIGCPSFEEELGRFKFYNSAFMLDPQGNISGSYSKVHLVPFGEYVPLQRFLPFINKLTEQSGDFFSGRVGETLNFTKGSAGVQICFEVIFPGLSRAMVKNGAQIIVNITNDAWFGKSSAPYQHFSMVKFRAVENKRAIARAANTGISGFIDPCGRVLSSTELFADSYLTRELPLNDSLTFYTRYGDVFALLCFPVLLWTFISKRKKNPQG